MSLFEPVYAASVGSMESRKRKGNSDQLTCRGVPLPYLIRPRRKVPVYDSFALYNDYLEYASMEDGLDSESDDDDGSSVKAVETSSLEKKGSIFGFKNESNASLSETGVSSGHSLNDESDEEYVIVRNVEALPATKTEKAGTIQMMELSKDAVDESESEDEGSKSDDWVVV